MKRFSRRDLEGEDVLNPEEAETVEELSEVGVAFLEIELEGGRCSLLHGDEQHPRVVIQCFSGFSVNELDLFDWLQFTWDEQLQRPGSCLLLEPDVFKGRHALLAGLFREDGSYLGFMHADREFAFSARQQEKLARFAEIYGRHLGTMVPAVPPEEAPAVVKPPATAEDDNAAFHQEWAWMDYV